METNTNFNNPNPNLNVPQDSGILPSDVNEQPNSRGSENNESMLAENSSSSEEALQNTKTESPSRKRRNTPLTPLSPKKPRFQSQKAKPQKQENQENTSPKKNPSETAEPAILNLLGGDITTAKTNLKITEQRTLQKGIAKIEARSQIDHDFKKKVDKGVYDEVLPLYANSESSQNKEKRERDGSIPPSPSQQIGYNRSNLSA